MRYGTQQIKRWSMAFLAGLLALMVVIGTACGSSADDAETTATAGQGGTTEDLVIGSALSRSGFLAAYDKEISQGMELAADQINAEGGVDGRQIKFVTSDSKGDLKLSAPAVLDVIDQGADVVVPECDANYGAPGARAAQEKGILAITCAGAPGFGAQSIGPLAFNVYTSAVTEGATIAEFAYNTKGWRSAYLLCDTFIDYSKTVCKAFKLRWEELGGTLAGEDTYVQTDKSVAAQASRLKAAQPFDFVALAGFPGETPVVKDVRSVYDGPIVGPPPFAGTFWLKPTPDLSNFYFISYGSPNGDDPNADVNEFFKQYEAKFGKPTVGHVPMLGYAIIETIAKGVEGAGTSDGKALGQALEQFKDESLVTGPTTYTKECHQPVGKPYVVMEMQGGQPKFSGDTVQAASVPPHPC